MICPKACPIVASPGDKFCYKCGAALIDQPKCVCGRMLTVAVDKFCPACGQPVAAPSTVGSAPPAGADQTPQGASNPESALGRFALNLPPELP